MHSCNLEQWWHGTKNGKKKHMWGAKSMWNCVVYVAIMGNPWGTDGSLLARIEGK